MYCFHNPFKLGKAPGKNSLKLLQKLLHSIQFWKKKKDMAWIINTAPDYMVEFNNMVIILYIQFYIFITEVIFYIFIKV